MLPSSYEYVIHIGTCPLPKGHEAMSTESRTKFHCFTTFKTHEMGGNMHCVGSEKTNFAIPIEIACYSGNNHFKHARRIFHELLDTGTFALFVYTSWKISAEMNPNMSVLAS